MGRAMEPAVSSHTRGSSNSYRTAVAKARCAVDGSGVYDGVLQALLACRRAVTSCLVAGSSGLRVMDWVVALLLVWLPSVLGL
jgi:hypothetical protein